MAWAITVDTVDLVSYVPVDSLWVEECSAQWDQWSALCYFEVEDLTNAVTIETEDDVDITEGGTTYFSGKVKELDIEILGGIGRRYRVTAMDWSCRLDECIVTSHTIDDGDNDDTEIGTIFASFCTDIDGSTHVAQLEADMPEMDLVGITVREALERVCEVTGGGYFVRMDKKLVYGDPNYALATAFGLSDAPDFVLSWGYENFQRRESSTRLAKRVYVVGDGVARWVTGGTYGAGDPEAVLVDPEIKDNDEADQRGAALLALYEGPIDSIECDTTYTGVAVRKKIEFVNTPHSISGQVRITRLRWRWLNKSGATRVFHVWLEDERLLQLKWERQMMNRMRTIATTLQDDIEDWPLPSAQGEMLRSDATPEWETFDASTTGAVLIGDGTDVVSDTTPSIAGLVTFEAGWVNTGGTGDLNGTDLILDADGDSYLHESADDVVDLVLAGAAGELGISINGAEDFTFTANAFNVLAGSAIQLSEYMYHAGDADTSVRFQADNITLRAGGTDLIDLVEAATDYVGMGAQVRLEGNDLFFDADDDSYMHASADDVVDLVLAGAAGEFGITINGAEDFTFTANALNVLAGSSIQLSEYLYHAGDADTFVQMEADQITVEAGGWAAMQIVEGASDYVVFNSTTVDTLFTAAVHITDGNLGVSRSGDPAAFHLYAYGVAGTDFPVVRGRFGRTSRALSSAAQSGDILVRFGGGGYGANQFNATSTGFVQMEAAQDFTNANMGTHLDLYTTPTGSTTAAQRVRVTASGRVKVGGTAGASGMMHIHEDAAAGVTTLYLEQDDNDKEFIRFHGDAAGADITRNIVDTGDATETLAGFVMVFVTDDGNQIADQKYWLPLYTLA